MLKESWSRETGLEQEIMETFRTPAPVVTARSHSDVPSNHRYVLGIVAHEWASDHWTGVIRTSDSDAPAEIKIDVYQATPITVRVTRGAGREPVKDAWIDLQHLERVEWIDSSGEEHGVRAGIGEWLRTDANGVARGAVGQGEIELRLSSGDWEEGQTIRVDSGTPVEVVFHRD